MPNCKEVVRLVASEELADAGWLSRVLVRLHLLMCGNCQSYVTQLRAIGAAARDRAHSSAADEAAFAELERAILRRCLDASDVDVEEGQPRAPKPPAEHPDPH